MSATAILDRLIAFPSVSSESNLDLIDWTRAYLASHGVDARLTRDQAGRKANVFASIGEGDGGIVLSGHTDVVPVTGQDWRTAPFVATHRDGRIYGRGACDMKGFIATALSLVPDLVKSPVRRPVHFAFTYDEEIGCLGVRRLLDDLATLPIQPRGCVVGEPTNMRVVVGHKGAGMYAYTVTGRAAHSSLAPFGVNAIEASVRIIERFRAIAVRLVEREQRHAGYDVPYTTVQVNRISGGSAGNIVADRCDFLVDIRSLPWTHQDELIAEVDVFIQSELLPEMRRVAPEADVTMRQVGDVPGFAIEADAPLVQEALAHSGSTECDHVAFGSEAGLFQRSGIPAIICGPGSIEQAHKPDEFVELAQLEACETMLRSLVGLG